MRLCFPPLAMIGEIGISRHYAMIWNWSWKSSTPIYSVAPSLSRTLKSPLRKATGTLPFEVRLAVVSMKKGTARGLAAYHNTTFPPVIDHLHKEGCSTGGHSLFPAVYCRVALVMKSLEWDERRIRVDGRFLRFVEDIINLSRNTCELQTMLKELEDAGKRFGPRTSRKTQLMRNAWCESEQVRFDGSPITETNSYV